MKLGARHCAICGKLGGTGMTFPLKWLREAGYAMKNTGDFAHPKCVDRAREKMKQKLKQA